ncbi:MAG: saccharopine dehydrogenase NADP-binding domain-containing protein [Gammaproteobacteria bacterium]|nr:saccharopine dehydrogenase NADP-binding domain-containing protein [Gammaproteobacteria bacterium]
MATTHWVGTGLSSIPGLKALIQSGRSVIAWNRTVETAQAALEEVEADIRAYRFEDLAAVLKAGDVVVSMLPGDHHVGLAKLCIEHKAHFVCSSYISPEMRALDAEATAAGVCVINEVGLDPGIDHLMAHELVARYRQSAAFDPANRHSFRSYCGGIPKFPNAFRYKFSWSPLGVLKALKSPSKSLKDGKPLMVDRPWDAISKYEVPLSPPETFEAYPNRDSTVFLAPYHFGADWKIDTFVRGTLRLDGWEKAWTPVFREIETLSGEAGEARLREMAAAFWRDNAYDEGEPDRVVLSVELDVENAEGKVFHQTYILDAWGDARGSAMARLVSGTVKLAIEGVLEGHLPAGVSAAPSDLATVETWMAEVASASQVLNRVDHLAG